MTSENKTYSDFEVGYKGSYTKRVTAKDNDLFAELSGDYNPLHFDDAIAQKLGFEGSVSNGFVAESRIAAALVETFGSPTSTVFAMKKNTRFMKPVYMDDEITATVEVVGRVEALNALLIQARCTNQRQEEVIKTEMTIKILAT